MLLLGTKDATIKSKLLSDGKKYSHHDVQNELLSIMIKHVLIKKVDIIRKNGFFAMCDEYTDVSNKEQLSFCIRTVNEQLIVDEAFLGYYEIANIKSETIVNAIKDILLRFGLEITNCRGQTYDGASNMLGKKTGVGTRILSLQSKALVTHCNGHSLSLSVKDLTSTCKILGDTMGTVGEITVLVKYLETLWEQLAKLQCWQNTWRHYGNSWRNYSAGKIFAKTRKNVG